MRPGRLLRLRRRSVSRDGPQLLPVASVDNGGDGTPVRRPGRLPEVRRSSRLSSDRDRAIEVGAHHRRGRTAPSRSERLDPSARIVRLSGPRRSMRICASPAEDRSAVHRRWRGREGSVLRSRPPSGRRARWHRPGRGSPPARAGGHRPPTSGETDRGAAARGPNENKGGHTGRRQRHE